MVDGLKLGDNAKAALITRGLREIIKFGVAQGASEATFMGLSGLGDLIATASSPLSRNRSAGERIVKGETLAQLQAQKKCGRGHLHGPGASCLGPGNRGRPAHH